MRQPLAITLQHDLPQGIGNLWKAIGNFWEGKDKDGNPLFNMPAWMTKPMGELFSDLGTSLTTWFEDIPTWVEMQKSIPKWLGGTKEGTFAWSDLGTTLSNWFEDLPT